MTWHETKPWSLQESLSTLLWSCQGVSITIRRSVRSPLPPLFLPLPQSLLSNLWQSQMPYLFPTSQRDPARLVTKAKKLREKNARTKTKGRSHLPRPKMPSKWKKQKPEPKRLNFKSRMLLALSQAKRRTLLLKHSPYDSPFFFCSSSSVKENCFVLFIYLFIL